MGDLPVETPTQKRLRQLAAERLARRQGPGPRRLPRVEAEQGAIEALGRRALPAQFAPPVVAAPQPFTGARLDDAFGSEAFIEAKRRDNDRRGQVFEAGRRERLVARPQPVVGRPLAPGERRQPEPNPAIFDVGKGFAQQILGRGRLGSPGFFERPQPTTPEQAAGQLLGGFIRPEDMTPEEAAHPLNAIPLAAPEQAIVGGIPRAIAAARRPGTVARLGVEDVRDVGKAATSPAVRAALRDERGFIINPGGTARAHPDIKPVFEDMDVALKELTSAKRSTLAKTPKGKERIKVAQAEVAGLTELHTNYMESFLAPEDLTRYQQRLGRLGEVEAELSAMREVRSGQAPSYGSKERLAWDSKRRKAQARFKSLNIERTQLRDEISSLEEGATFPKAEPATAQPTVRQGDTGVQPGFAGDMAPGGQQDLFAGFQQPVEKAPLADAENLAARQARRAEVARGQGEFPTPATPSAAAVAPERPIPGIRRTTEAATPSPAAARPAPPASPKPVGAAPAPAAGRVTPAPAPAALPVQPAAAQAAAPKGPRQPRAPRQAPAAGGTPPPSNAALSQMAIPGEDNARAGLRLFSGARHYAANQARQWVDQGDKLLKEAGVTTQRGGRVSPDRQTAEALLTALHGEGPVPPRFQAVFDDLKRLMDIETQEMLVAEPGFAKSMIPGPDYFPRLWREPKMTRTGGALGAKPFFKKARVDATFQELLQAGYEPVSWNPYDMLVLRRISGVEYREGKILAERLKKSGQAIPVDAAPREGWRVPRVGPAFEGRPFPTKQGGAALTTPIAVPDHVADVLESIYGRKISLRLGGHDVLPAIDTLANGAKRAKLMGSLFQHLDFATRTGAELVGTPAGVLNGGLVNFPIYLGRAVEGQFLESGRAATRARMLSDKPILKGSTISMKMIVQQGLEVGGDTSVFRRSILSFLDDAAKGAPTTRRGKVFDRMGGVNRFFEKGLFENIYPLSMEYTLKHSTVPTLKFLHPDWSDVQIAASAAEEANKMFSSLGNWQTVLAQPAMKKFAQTIIFSTNETESAIRMAVSTVHGKNKALWIQHWAGLAIFIGLLANIIHYATKGEPLPEDRYAPVKRGGPLGVSYNPDFLAPDMPITGADGDQIRLDIVGQADTVFMLALDPAGSAGSRLNVLPRAAITQATGKPFYGDRLETPLDRGKALASDLALPIGAGNVAQSARERYPALQPYLPAGERRVGAAGNLVQASGLNLRADPTNSLYAVSERGERDFQAIGGIKGLDLHLGQVGKSFDLTPGETGDSIELTPQQRVAYQNMMARTVIPGMQSLMEELERIPLPPQAKKAQVKKRMDALKEQTRTRYRNSLLLQGVKPQQEAAAVGR